MPQLVVALVALAALALALPVPLLAQSEADSAAANLQYRAGDIVLYVDGMTCPFCAYGLEKKLSRLEAVDRVDIDLDSGRVVLRLKDGQSLSDGQLERAVDEAGFSLRKIERPKTDSGF